MKRIGVLVLLAILLVSFTFVMGHGSDSGEDDDDSTTADSTDVDAAGLTKDRLGNGKILAANADRIQAVRTEAIKNAVAGGIQLRARDSFTSEYDNLRLRYAHDKESLREKCDQLIERIESSDLTEDEKEALISMIRKRKEIALNNAQDFKDELDDLKKRYRHNKAQLTDVSNNFLEHLRTSNLTDEEKEELRNEIDELRSNARDIRGDLRDRLDELRDERRDAVERSRELLELAKEDGDLTDEEREAIREELEEMRTELREAKKEFRDEARNIRVEFRGELADFIAEIRDKYTLSDGREVDVKIMPDVASERAIERLELEACNEENSCEIDFVEVGGEDARLRYSLKAKKEGRFLGLFRTNLDVEGEVDAETGEVVRTRKPWFAFLVNE